MLISKANDAFIGPRAWPKARLYALPIRSLKIRNFYSEYLPARICMMDSMKTMKLVASFNGSYKIPKQLLPAHVRLAYRGPSSFLP